MAKGAGLSRILFALDKYRTKHGGADRQARAVAEGLVQQGHVVRVLEPGTDEPVEQQGVQLTSQDVPQRFLFRDGDWVTLRLNIHWHDAVVNAIKGWEPDLVLTQNRLAPSSVAAAAVCGVRSAILFHGYRCLSPNFYEGQDALTAPDPSFSNMPWLVRLKWPIVKLALDLYHAAYKRADVLVANSMYIKRVLELKFRREAKVFYPIMDLPTAETIPVRDEPPKKVLFVKPQRIKGLDVLIKVAPLCPDLEFTVVGHASNRVKKRLQASGIQHAGWIDNMDAFYAGCGALFAPAQIPEPFGRVFVEAGLQGVVSVASRSGGIPEAVGDGGLLLPMDASPIQWADALHAVLQKDQFSSRSQQAFRHAQNLVADHTAQRLARTLGVS